MKTKKWNKVVPATALLLIAALLLSTASYAWFTMSKAVTATGMELTAVAPDNLLISKTQYKKSDSSYDTTVGLTTDDFGSMKLFPSSSYDGVKFFKPSATTVTGEPATTATFSAATVMDKDNDGYYMQAKLFLLNTGAEEMSVGLDLANSYVSDKAGNDNLAGAVRYSVTIDADKSETINAGDTTKIFGVVKSGDSWTSNVNYFATLTGPIKGDEGTDFYKGTKLDASAINNGTLEADKFFISVPGNGRADFDGTAGQIDNNCVSLIVNVWIEGQDPDCENTKVGDTFGLNLAFVTKS